MKRRVLAALLVTMMTVGTVAGCGSNAKSDDSDKKQWECSVSDESPLGGVLKSKMAFRIAEAEGK